MFFLKKRKFKFESDLDKQRYLNHQDFKKLIYSLLNVKMNTRQYKIVLYVGIRAKQKEGNNHIYRYRNRIYCVCKRV